MQVCFSCICPNCWCAAATHHIELLPQNSPFLQRGGGLCDNRVLQGHHSLAQAEGRKHAQHEHAHYCTREGVAVMLRCGHGGRCCRLCACGHFFCHSTSTNSPVGAAMMAGGALSWFSKLQGRNIVRFWRLRVCAEKPNNVDHKLVHSTCAHSWLKVLAEISLSEFHAFF